MTEYKCKDGDRIDDVVYKHYGSLEPLAKVLFANPHLLELPIILNSPTIIKLPKIDDVKSDEVVENQRQQLW
jgi:phage tail protein X